MRVSSLAILVALAGGTLPVQAAQDVSITTNGVEAVCTGVGSAKDNPAWSSYPVKLTFSNPAGQNEATEHIAIVRNGKTLMETDCDAPWLLIRAPAGHYDVQASLPGSNRTANASFTAGGGSRQQTINLAFAG